MIIYYTEEHEWILVEGDIATVGITSFAQEQLGDIVFVELPSIGTSLLKNSDSAVVESVKAASDVYSPITGVVVEINEALETDPSVVNTDPENAGWFYKLSIGDQTELEGLMDLVEYLKYIS